VRLGAPGGVLEETRTSFMRYRGQGHEVAVKLSVSDAIDPAALRTAFDETYARLYGRVIPGLEVEALTWVLSLAEAHALPARSATLPDREPGVPAGSQNVIDPATGMGAPADTYMRADLPPGARLPGPAVVLEDGTSTIVPPGFTARLGAAGELLIEDVEAAGRISGEIAA
jgi:N-methylhydantoinase A